jgi:hypothetical protein
MYKSNVNGKPLLFQETMKYLGVKIDHILQFDSPVEYVKNKITGWLVF